MTSSKRIMLLSLAALGFVCSGPVMAKTKYKNKKLDKRPITIKRGDSALTVGGKTRIEHYFKKHVAMLNNSLPDQAEYFKHYVDVLFDYNVGQKKYGHKAVQAFVDLRHKGVWGLGSTFADSDASLPTNVQISDSVLKDHSHQNGKPLVWVKDAWLQFSFNAALNQYKKHNVHYIKFGWFPFELGRGISLGAVYGLNREGLGLYSYPEDKSTPGINISGEIIKKRLSYDLYYSKFEERDKSLRYTLNTVKEQHLGRKANPWRGVGKDDEVFAARLKWKALKDSKFGTLDLEPYVFYNEASDQTTEVIADTKTELGSLGLAFEHKYKHFEIGGEIATNFGDEILQAIDRNHVTLERDPNGQLVEVFSHIYDENRLDANGKPSRALVTQDNQPAALKEKDQALHLMTLHNADPNDALFATHNIKVKNRFRDSYKNRLRGWMAVVDMAYTSEDYGFSVATGYGYASGDTNPHVEEKNKTYEGFIGLHELYTGKRIKSVFFDDRLLKIPSSLGPSDDVVTQELAFTNMHQLGFSATWQPNCFKKKKFRVNPNMLLFWKAKKSFKWELDQANNIDRRSDELARRYVGTELNLMADFQPIKDLTVYGYFAAFIPGSFYDDIKGTPLSKDFFKVVQTKAPETDLEKQDFRIGDDNAYHMNIGMTYKF